jgi:hypothetical protein
MANIQNKKKLKKDEHDEKQSELMRRFRQQPFIFTGTVVVLVLVVVSFVFWGAGDWILPNRSVLSNDQLTFGYWDDVPVELTPGSFFAQIRQSYIDFYRGNYGWSGESADMQATRQAFDLAIVRTAILDAAKKARYAPPRTLVDKKVSELPKYQENGVFSVLRYRQETAAQHIKTVQEVRDDMIVERYQDDVMGKTSDDDEAKFTPVLKIASKEADFFAGMAAPQRSFSMAIFPYSSFPDSEIVVYVDKNPEPFKNTHLSQITVTASENDAKQVLTSIQNGTTSFEDAAIAQSKDTFATNGGDAGERMVYELDALIPAEADRTTVINLPAGSLSQVVKTGAGWTIFRAESATTTADTSNQAILNKIRGHLSETERGVIEDWLIARAGDFTKTAETGDFTEVAGQYDAQTADFGPVSLNYGDSSLFTTLSSSTSTSNNELRAAGTSENFWKTAFSTAVGRISAPFVIDASLNSVVVLEPVSESADDEEAAAGARTAFSDTFVNNDIESSVQNAILNSDKFRNDFTARYYTVFPPSTGQDGNLP